MRSQAIQYQSKEELDLILEEESSLLTTKQRKQLSRKARKQNNQQQNSNVESISNYQNKRRRRLEAQTDTQQQLMNTIIEYDQTIVVGPAGTGKTFVTSAMAATMLKDGQIDKIVLTRPNVATGRSIGFFPGSLEEKMEPWIAPIMNVFKQYISPGMIDMCLKDGRIEIVPFEVIRGRSFENAFIILDEAQNTTIDEMKAFLTRQGEGSKVVIDGDVRQSDINTKNGLKWAADMIDRSKYLRDNVGYVRFTTDDIVRSGLCKAWVTAIEKDERSFI